MTSAERIQNCFDVGPVKDRRDIPLYPQLITYTGKFAGITQKQMVDDPKKFMQALKTTFDYFGCPDLSINLPLGDIIFSEGLSAKRPGYELPDDEQFQFIEKSHMGLEDYHDIINNGWDGWYSRYLRSIQNPPIKSNFALTLRWIKVGMHGGALAKFLRGMGVEPIAGAATYPMFDMLSLLRSFADFCVDLYTEPELIMDVINSATPGMIKSTLTNAGRGSVKRIQLYAMRSDANSVSPDMFDEFVFPSLKLMVETFLAAGYKTVLHADGNWLPMLDRFLKLPKASVHFEFDGLTDMFKAYEIIGGWHSMRGDVPATMLAFGTADEVSEYCERLITGIGMKGGFALGSGCEVPMNCKSENLMAMMKSVRG